MAEAPQDRPQAPVEDESAAITPNLGPAELSSMQQLEHEGSNQTQIFSPSPPSTEEPSPAASSHPIDNGSTPAGSADATAPQIEMSDHPDLTLKLPQDSQSLASAVPIPNDADDEHSEGEDAHGLWMHPTKPSPEVHPGALSHKAQSSLSSIQTTATLPEIDAIRSQTPNTTRSETSRRIMDESRRDLDAVSVASDSIVYTPKSSPLRPYFPSGELELNSSPDLSDAHKLPPKETHQAEVDIDPVSGRKIINEYEVLSELGRGQHGKVKLCRSLTTNQTVAVKIIERESKQRRLGRSSNQETKIKREIAILKKARHQNIVSLLEFIDDPTLKKVYIVLEHVQHGEIKWRIKGEPEICMVEYHRTQRDLLGILDSEEGLRDDEAILQEAAAKRKQIKDEEARRVTELQFRLGPWSLEHGGDSDTESVAGMDAGESSSAANHSNQFLSANANNNANRHSGTFQTDEYKTAVEGNLFGSYSKLNAGQYAGNRDSYQSDIDDESYIPENFTWVPRLTLEEARRAMRDTVLGLEFLHYQGIIHRDIKPANLLLTHDYRIKISDFGVSYLGKVGKASTEHGGEDQSETDNQDHDEAIELAKTVGTPAFYAPELCVTDFDENNPPMVTGLIDVWALGVTLYCLVYGRVPFYDQNTFALMRHIAETPVHVPRKRLRAVEVDNLGRVLFDPAMQAATAQNPENRRRLGNELVYEEVNDDLFNLLHGLLEKDPKKRLKLHQVKKHPWLLAGMHDPNAWVKESDPSLVAKGKKIEVSKEDVEKAVVHMNLVQNIKTTAKGILGTFTEFVKSNSSRRRAKSSAADPGSQPPSTASSSSNMSQDATRLEARRSSLRPDELVSSALRASRNSSEHPLSQSVTASPIMKESRQFFTTSVPESPAAAPTSSPSWKGRPDMLERGASATGSIRTIRPTDVAPDGFIPLTAPWPLHSFSEHSQIPVSMFGGVLKRPGLQELGMMHHNPSELSAHDENIRAEPTVGISNMTASGLLNLPAVLQDHVSACSTAPSPLSFKPESVASGAEFIRIRGSDTMSRASSNHSVSSLASRSKPTVETYSGQAQGSFLPLMHEAKSGLSREARESENDKLRKAKDDQIRRLIKEGQDNLQSSNGPASDPNLDVACPPSPDDLPMSNPMNRPPLFHGLSAPDLEAASHPHNHQFHSHHSSIQQSYSEDHIAAEISQSTSNKSLPSALSASSSIGVGMSAGVSGYALHDKVHGMDTPTAYQDTYQSSDYLVDDTGESYHHQMEDDDSGDDSDDFVEMAFSRKSKSTASGPTASSSSQAN
jgi:serine/threonine protein kinase